LAHKLPEGTGVHDPDTGVRGDLQQVPVARDEEVRPGVDGKPLEFEYVRFD
jgi:hypothetical protein